jgi:hypothetical protein
MKKDEIMLTAFADKLMAKFMELNPDDKPISWCIKLISNDQEYKNAALMSLSNDVSLLCLPEKIHDVITNEAVFDFFEMEDSWYLFALVQSKFA